MAGDKPPTTKAHVVYSLMVWVWRGHVGFVPASFENFSREAFADKYFDHELLDREADISCWAGAAHREPGKRWHGISADFVGNLETSYFLWLEMAGNVGEIIPKQFVGTTVWIYERY